MSFGHRINCGLAAIAALAALAGALFPAAAPAAADDREALALNLINTQSCAQHYADDAQTVAQATSQPTLTPPPAPEP